MLLQHPSPSAGFDQLTSPAAVDTARLSAHRVFPEKAGICIAARPHCLQPSGPVISGPIWRRGLRADEVLAETAALPV